MYNKVLQGNEPGRHMENIITMHPIVEKIKSALIPENYKYLDSFDSNTIECVFRGRDFIIARYMLAIVHSNDIQSLQSKILEIRKEIKNKYKAIYGIREIGLQILIYGEDILSKNEIIPTADKFGNHAVIVQGIHVVDTASFEVAYDQTKWGKIKFGAAKKINEIINKNITI